MTEKRSEYRKKAKHQKNRGFLNTIKSAFDDDNQEVDVNPEFTRTDQDNVQINQQRESEGRKRRNEQGNRDADQEKKEDSSFKREAHNQSLSSQDKALRLKKKLNHAIIIVFVLIVLVLLALFHL